MSEGPRSRRRRRLHAWPAVLRCRRRRIQLAVYTRPRTSPALPRHHRVRGLAGAFGAMVMIIGGLGSTGHLAAARTVAVTAGTAAVARTFGAGNSTGGNTLSASPSTATTAGDLLVAVIRTRSISGSIQPVTHVADSHGESWSRAADKAAGQGDQSTWYFAGALSLTTSQSVTVTAGTATTTAIAFTVLEIAGATPLPLDVTATNAGTSQSASTGSTATTTQASEIAIADIGWNGTGSASGSTPGYTVVGAQKSTVTNTTEAEQAAWHALSLTGSQTFGVTLSSSVPWSGAIATFKLVAHVMLIVEENQEYGGIIGNSNAPYINSLATKYRSASKWYAVQHNSPTDYLELLAGSNLGWPVPCCSSTATTLVDELHAKSIPWKGYMESMPSTSCYTGTTTNGLYDVIHNPFRYFTKYTTNSGGWCSSTNLSKEGVLTYPGSSSLVSTLNAANPPDFVWITPNDCDNMHGDTNTGSPCASSTKSQLVKAGDTWLSNNIASVISSSWFSHNGIIIITWDEGTTSAGCCNLSAPGGHIATIVVTTKNAGLGSYTGTGDHYGTLAAIEKAYRVSLLLNSANAINGNLTGAFGP
jgi:phosphatidylinositol-3-phosphatase